MIETTYNNALYEVYEIISYLSEESKSKIPRKLIEYIEENKSNNYNFELDTTALLEEQKLLPETEAFITIIYRDYLCNDESKIKELNEMINKNDLLHEEILNEKNNKLFDNKNKREIKTSLPVKIEKENFWMRIINFIKSRFKQ